jgi:ribonuclease P protein component
MTEKLGKTDRVLNRKHFVSIQQNGKKIHNEYFVLIGATSLESFPRIGITVSRRCEKKAVKRNLFKRRIRALFRKSFKADLAGIDFVVIAKPEAIFAPFKLLQKQYEISALKLARRIYPQRVYSSRILNNCHLNEC